MSHKYTAEELIQRALYLVLCQKSEVIDLYVDLAVKTRSTTIARVIINYLREAGFVETVGYCKNKDLTKCPHLELRATETGRVWWCIRVDPSIHKMNNKPCNKDCLAYLLRNKPEALKTPLGP